MRYKILGDARVCAHRNWPWEQALGTGCGHGAKCDEAKKFLDGYVESGALFRSAKEMPNDL